MFPFHNREGPSPALYNRHCQNRAIEKGPNLILFLASGPSYQLHNRKHLWPSHAGETSATVIQCAA